jgi:PAS domain S-box-containing protein
MKTTTDLTKTKPNFLDVLNALPFYAFLVDSQHHILAANEAVRRDLGLDPERLIGAYCPRVLHGCGSPITNCPLTKALETGYAAEEEIFDSKSEKWLNAAVYPIQLPSEDQSPIYLHFARDITEFKKTARGLSESLEHQWAMSNLLQKLQYCRDGDEILRVLIDQILCLSWTGMSVKAAGFLQVESSFPRRALPAA